MSLRGSNPTNYFRKSPFRSWPFDFATLILVLFVVSDIRALQLQPQMLKASQAILGLVFIPVVVWTIALMAHWEMRVIIEKLGDMESTRISLAQERLARLHYGLVLGITIGCYAIIHALTATVH